MIHMKCESPPIPARQKEAAVSSPRHPRHRQQNDPDLTIPGVESSPETILWIRHPYYLHSLSIKDK
jgi:hypothetical protein